VRDDVDVESAAKNLAVGATFNAGQSCCSVEVSLELDCKLINSESMSMNVYMTSLLRKCVSTLPTADCCS
jgi:hypothetical protein